ncbi:MAG: DUF1343 domain-containing protein [Anaerolineae bacterium]|nr:DUF1343 domain-containing protein [Anaerolineae bacterium]
MNQAAVRCGSDVLQKDGFRELDGQRVGLLSNLSALDGHLRSTYQVLWQAEEVNLVALFGPEHGFSGAAPDAEQIGFAADPRTGLPVHSLYGATYRPTTAMFDGIDTLVFDIQDVGVRYYTFTWTLSYVLEAAGEYGVRVVVLDRPNPLGGAVAGPPLDYPALSSFVGRFPVPVQHGMTLGELARLFNAHWNPTPAELTVVPCQGWGRSKHWPQTGLPWAGPSPNIPRYTAAMQYPGSCLVEGTILSEGRGTPLPFEVAGAPWIDAVALADHLNAQAWPGVRCRAHTFQPSASKWAGQHCGGVQVYVTDETAWRPIETWLGFLAAIRALYPAEFAWLPPHQTDVEPGAVHHFDRLIGSAQVRQQIEAGAGVDEITAGWGAACAAFEALRAPFLLYD